MQQRRRLLASFFVSMTLVGAGCSMSARVKGDEVLAVGDPHPELVTKERFSDRGVERVREVERRDDLSIVRVETDYYGGAMDGVMFGQACLSRIAEYRGFTHWVILEDHIVRTGDLDQPGNDWELTLGLLHGEPDRELTEIFPGHSEPKGGYRVWSVYEQNSVSLESMMSSSLWHVFSSIHFRRKK